MADKADKRGGWLHWLGGKVAYSAGFGVMAMLVVGAVMFYFHERNRSAPQIVRIAYSAGGPVRKHFIDQMALHGKKFQLDIRAVPTEGADMTMDMIDRRDAELGLIPGAIDDMAGRGIYEVAPLYMEPLQLLVRARLYDEVIKDFGALRGMSISMDGTQSTTRILATEVLKFIGLIDPVTGAPAYRPVDLTQAQYAQQKDEAALPDAIFQIGGIPSPSIRALVLRHNYRLVALPFGAAFDLYKFREEEPVQIKGQNLVLNRSFVDEFTIPAFTYGGLPPVPADDTKTIATRLILVGARDLSHRTVSNLINLVLSPEIASLAAPPLDVELVASDYQFQRHSGTEAYLRTLKPVDVEGVFTTYGRLVEVWGIVIAVYLAARKWLRDWRDRRAAIKRKSVGDFLLEVLEVESEAGPAATTEDRRTLDQRLTEIKKTAIQLYLDDELDSCEQLGSLLTTLSDTRARIWERTP